MAHMDDRDLQELRDLAAQTLVGRKETYEERQLMKRVDLALEPGRLIELARAFPYAEGLRLSTREAAHGR